MKTCGIKKITLPTHMAQTPVSVINSVHWRSVGSGRGEELSVARKAGREADYSEQSIY